MSAYARAGAFVAALSSAPDRVSRMAAAAWLLALPSCMEGAASIMLSAEATKDQRAVRRLATLSRSIRNRFGTSDRESVMRTPRQRRR